MKKQTIFLAIAAFLFLSALCLPGIIYKPNLAGHPRVSFCANATSPGSACYGDPAGRYTCNIIDRWTERQPPIDRKSIERYCDGWQIPSASADYGISLLAWGWQGMLAECFAWLANPFGIMAFGCSVARRFKVAFVMASLAFGIAPTAFLFREEPLDEGGVQTLYVDHLGTGFYV